jgi:iron complex transport system substrate-binding protein
VHGTATNPYPERIVCLSTDATEIVFALGRAARVVGVPGTVRRPPEARGLAKVGGFTTFRLDRILTLDPDLVIGFSDLQADVAREVVRAGVPCLVLNARSLVEIYRSILMVGGAVGAVTQAEELVADMQDEIRQVREFSAMWPRRPRVYFEEWDAPPIAGIRWVSELIEAAGGQDVFAELRERRDAPGRVVDPAEVIRRQPELIVASWCGKPVDLGEIRRRPGWSAIEAVRAGRVHALPPEDILSPGPAVLHGLRSLHDLIQRCLTDDPAGA